MEASWSEGRAGWGREREKREGEGWGLCMLVLSYHTPYDILCPFVVE